MVDTVKEEREKVIRDLHLVDQDLLGLALDQQIFQEVSEIIRSNSDLKAMGSEFFGWILRGYVARGTMGLRRQADSTNRAVSLVKIIRRLKNRSSIASRTWYVSQAATDDDWTDRFAHDTYDRLVGEGVQLPGRDYFDRDLEEIEKTTEWIVDYGVKRIAHLDSKPPSQIPTFKELETASGLLNDILRRYMLLLTGVDSSRDVTFQYDWKAVLKIPWIPSDLWPFPEKKWEDVFQQVKESGSIREIRHQISPRDDYIIAMILSQAQNPESNLADRISVPSIARRVKECAKKLNDAVLSQPNDRQPATKKPWPKDFPSRLTAVREEFTDHTPLDLPALTKRFRRARPDQLTETLDSLESLGLLISFGDPKQWKVAR